MNGYTKTTWVDNSVPAINAENLNHIEQGIKDVTDEVADGTVHFVNVSSGENDAADSCIEPNTLYYVRVVSSIVTWGKMYLICTPENSATHVKSQIAFSMDGYLITRSSTNDVWGDWVKIPSATEISTMIQNAISGKANSSDVYTKTEVNNGFVDSSTYNTDIGNIETALIETESVTNKQTAMPPNPTDTQYLSALGIKNFVNNNIENMMTLENITTTLSLSDLDDLVDEKKVYHFKCNDSSIGEETKLIFVYGGETATSPLGDEVYPNSAQIMFTQSGRLLKRVADNDGVWGNVVDIVGSAVAAALNS